MANKTNLLLLCLAVASTVLLGSCDDVMGGKTSLVFPSQMAFDDVVPGDTVHVSFTSDVYWQLSSDAMWCKVDGALLDTSGEAGSQSVAFVIGDEARTVDASKANISLRLGDETRVIAVVTRKGITDAVVMGCDTTNYSHGQTLVIGTSGTQSLVLRKVTFDSNNLYVSSNADWFDIVREDSVFTLTVKEDFLKYNQCSAADSICFSDKDKPMMRLNVHYTGMDARSVVLTPETQWDVVVSVDGTTYKDAMYEMSGEIYEAPFTSVVATLNDAYTLYYATYDKAKGCTLVDVDSEQWFAVQDDKKGNLSITFEANEGEQRIAYVFVLPQMLNDSLNSIGENAVADFLLEEIENKLEVNGENEQYLVVELIQENALADYFSIQRGTIQGGTEMEDIEFVRETDDQWINLAVERGVPANQIFRTCLEVGVPYNVNPKLSVEEWKPDMDGGAHIELGRIDGTIVEEKENKGTEEKPKIWTNYKAEPAMTEDDLYYYMQFRTYLEEESIIYFVDDQGNCLKALVVEPILD